MRETRILMGMPVTVDIGDTSSGALIDVVAGSFEATSLRTGSQGVVFGAFRSFQHVLTTEAQLAALAECRRILRPGGVLALDLFDPAYHLLRRARPSHATQSS